MGYRLTINDYESTQAETQTLRNALGKYEDLGTVEELKELVLKGIKERNNKE